jgi:hypothetical protein
LEDCFLLWAKILADDGDHTHIGKEAGGQRKMRGCAAQATLTPSRRRLN